MELLREVKLLKRAIGEKLVELMCWIKFKNKLTNIITSYMNNNQNTVSLSQGNTIT